MFTKWANDLVNVASKISYQALLDAIEKGDLNFVKKWIDGVNLETVVYPRGLTFLQLACRYAHKEIVEFLVDKGASVHNGAPLMMVACGAEGDYKEVIEYLWRKGADFNVKNDDGCTPLMRSAERYKELTELLVQKGANVNEKNKKGVSALMIACIHHQTEIIKFLVQQGADINEKDNDGETALMKAYGCKENLTYLVQQGADINAKDKQGVSILIKASGMFGWKDDIENYVQLGADVNAKDNNGTTGLMNAVFRGDINIIRYLLEKGANKNLRTKDGKTALMIAIEESKEAVVEILENFGSFQSRLDKINYKNEIPKDYEDPISLEIMEDPITLPSSGLTYDRGTLFKYFVAKGNPSEIQCPITRQPILRDELMKTATTISIKSSIEEFVAEKEYANLKTNNHKIGHGLFFSLNNRQSSVNGGQDSSSNLEFVS